MSKEELYRDLCKEAGTYDGTSSPREWYEACAHNIHKGLDESLGMAASGDVAALAEVRTACGLPAFA
jgi:hypothetical protein